jgi:C1A family cysteine protease
VIDVRVRVWLVLMLLFVAAAVRAQEARMAPQREAVGYAEDRFLDSEYPRGLTPPPFAPHTVTRTRPLLAALQAPIRFDYREQGVVTGVRQQGSCGACYAFAALADFEAKLLMAGEGEFDFSENNVKECEWFGRTGHYPAKCQGGTYWRVVNHLAEFGTVLEGCDPYRAYNSTCREGCPYIKTALNWRVFSLDEIPPVETMKTYLLQKGPVYAAIDAGHYTVWANELNAYDGSYTLYYTGSPTDPALGAVNHAVLIIGWDDTLSHAGGQGAWICKNSWGPSWGGTAGYGTERGYFTIAYGSANLGYYASFMEEWQDYDPCERLLFYDEAGYYGQAGYGGVTAWGMCKFIMEQDAELRRVEFWTTDATTDVDIYVYDDLSGAALQHLLASELNNSYTEMGYHSVPLATPLEASAGEDIYVAVKFTNASYTWPLTTDPSGIGPTAPGMCYISPTGTAWSEAKFRDQYDRLIPVDLGIRLRVRYAGDCEPPDTVSGFRAIPGDSLVMLRWTNPADEDFSHVLIRYSAASYPVVPAQGSPVENGYDGEFYGDPSADGSFVHTGRVNNVTYYYSAFAADTGGLYSGPVMAAATPGDEVPPGAVLNFTAEGGDRSVKLRWTGPDDVDLAGVRIRYSTVASPLTLEEGMPVENGTKDYFETQPASPDSFLHSGLTNDTTYYYTIWAFDGMTNYSQAKNSEATAIDNVPPEFAISVLQNPYLSNYLDIYVTASEAIEDTSLTVTVDGGEVDVSPLPGQPMMFTYDYEIYASGPLEISACARDLVLNQGCTYRVFHATRVTRLLGGNAASIDGRMTVAVPGGVLDDAYILIGEASEIPGPMLALYTVSPASARLDGSVAVSISYSAYEAEPAHLCIARVEDGMVHPLESYVDRASERILAYTDRLGAFGLLARPDVETPVHGGGEIVIYPNIPNPFGGSTLISFVLPDARPASVRVYSADGRLVRDLLDAALAPGRHTVTWDGTDRWGARAADGIYFVRVSTPQGSATGKMVMLR